MAGDENFLSRWSRRKIEARTSTGLAEPAETPPQAPSQAAPAASAPEPPAVPAQPLPDPATLTPESDFTAFMSRDVDAPVRNQALKTLFSDPHFNTMDMLDVYVDDYSKPDPLPAGWLEQLEQMAGLGDRAERDRQAARQDRAEDTPAGDRTGPEAAATREGEPAPAGGGMCEPASSAESSDPSRDPNVAAIPSPKVGESGT